MRHTPNGTLADSDGNCVVLLGASNLTLAWSTVMEQIGRRFREPLRVLTAHGMGRSWMMESRFAWRSIPGILECGLWQSMEDSSELVPSAALITDLGNDLIYGRSAEALADAAAETVARIRRRNPRCKMVVTRPPLRSIDSLSSFRFLLFRTLLFPFCRVPLDEVVREAHELDRRIQGFGDVTVVGQQQCWFGLDPVHIRRRSRRAAFSAFLSSWPAQDVSQQPPLPGRRPTIARHRVAGRIRTAAQPSVVRGRNQVFAW